LCFTGQNVPGLLRKGFRWPARSGELRGQDFGQIVKADTHVRMLGPQRLLVDGQCAPVEPLSFGIPALRMIEQRQVVEAGRKLRMRGPQRLLEDIQGALVQ
jgi:hypothetical protein